MKVIAERLYLLREGAHLSQAKLAEKIGTSQASVNRYEKDNCDPPPETLLWYADYFNVSLDYIFGRTDNTQGGADIRHVVNGEDWEQFVEMCFDPTSPVSAKFKKAMIDLMGSDKS